MGPLPAFMRLNRMRSSKAALALSLAWLYAIGSPSVAYGQTAQTPEPAAVHLTPTSLPNLFTETVRDVRRLPSKESLIWLGVGAAAAALVQPADRHVSNVVAAPRSLHTVFEPGETIGGARFQMGGAVATYALGRLTGSPKATRVGADLVRAQFPSPDGR